MLEKSVRGRERTSICLLSKQIAFSVCEGKVVITLRHVSSRSQTPNVSIKSSKFMFAQSMPIEKINLHQFIIQIVKIVYSIAKNDIVQIVVVFPYTRVPKMIQSQDMFINIIISVLELNYPNLLFTIRTQFTNQMASTRFSVSKIVVP